MFHKPFLFTLLSLAFLPTTTTTAAFPDVTEETKYQSAIEYLAEQGIINGYADGNFGPENTLTRAELLKILLEAKEGFVKPNTPTEPCFPDVEITDWYAPYVCYAKDNGIVEGFPDGTMRPNKEVSKAEAVKLLVESREYPLPDTIEIQKTFPDADATQWYAPYAQYMFNENLLPEKDDSTFYPAKVIPRNLIAEYLFRSMTREQKKKALGIGTPISLSAEEYAKIKNLVTPIREFYYGSYWLELTDEDIQKIPVGVQYEVEEDAFVIKRGGYRFDPLLEQPDIPVELQAVEEGENEKGLYLIQFYAPAKNEWITSILDMEIKWFGSSSIGYGALVWATPNQLQAAQEQFDFIRAVVPFHGKFKIAPTLADKIGQTVDVDVWYYYDGTNYETTTNRLVELGGVSKDLQPHAPVAKGRSSMRFGFELGVTTLYELARMPQVMSLSWGAPIVEL